MVSVLDSAQKRFDSSQFMVYVPGEKLVSPDLFISPIKIDHESFLGQHVIVPFLDQYINSFQCYISDLSRPIIFFAWPVSNCVA